MRHCECSFIPAERVFSFYHYNVLLYVLYSAGAAMPVSKLEWVLNVNDQ